MKDDAEAEMMRQVAIKMERWHEAIKQHYGPEKVPVKGQIYESPGGMQFKIIGATKKDITVEVDRVVRKSGKQISETRTRVVPRALFQSFARAYEAT